MEQELLDPDYSNDNMPTFERTDVALIKKEIDEQITQPRVGVVTQVYEHADGNDDSNWEVDVEIDNSIVERRVPVHAIGNDMIVAPKNGDKVLIVYTDGETSRPIAYSTGWSNTDRPPVGRAGIYRNVFESGDTPAGSGDLHITGYTEYDQPVSSFDKRELNPQETRVQIAKHASDENINPADGDDIPAKIEMYDSVEDDESWISVEINAENGGSSAVTWGMKFNIKTGEWKLVGPNGFGISADGDGNFVWDHKSIDFNEVSGGTGNLSL